MKAGKWQTGYRRAIMAEKDKLKYMIIGAGGTGGAAGSHLARAGFDVTFIARGKHLAAMREKGLSVLKPAGDFRIDSVKACTTEEFLENLRCGSGCGTDAVKAAECRPDVIFVCLKGYSVDGMIPFLAEAAGPDTVIIPVLNIFGTGGKMQEKLLGVTVTDGCIYVASEISEPGVILMKGDILRIVFGLRRDQKNTALEEKVMPVLEQVRDDLCTAGIKGILSDNIERDALRKFSYVSPQGACGLYYNVPIGAVQKPGEERDCFAGLVSEISDLADAMGIGFGEDIVKINLEITEGLAPDMTTSLQRDVARGGASEIDGLIYEVPRLAAKYGVSLPLYEKIAAALKERGL